MLLIDEIDRADEEFEAFLLELLSDFQITIPEIGTIRAEQPPVVVITSNRTREVHDALKRRCLYHWIDYPSSTKSCASCARKCPAAAELLARQVVAFVQELRRTISTSCPAWPRRSTGPRRWWRSTRKALDPTMVDDTLGVILKYQDDVAAAEAGDAEARSWTA